MHNTRQLPFVSLNVENQQMSRWIAKDNFIIFEGYICTMNRIYIYTRFFLLSVKSLSVF